MQTYENDQYAEAQDKLPSWLIVTDVGLIVSASISGSGD